MKIYLLDRNKGMTDAWAKCFNDLENVEIVNDDFAHFMDEHPEIDCVVSPANSFGLMDGGYDKAITDYFGTQLMKDVQDTIIDEWYGEQPVGSSFYIRIRNENNEYCFSTDKHGKHSIVGLIHTPTMRTPEIITDYRIIYQCMRTTLIEALGSEYIVIPAFGGCCGQVPYDEIAKMMYLAYEQICNPPKEITWKYAIETKISLK